MHRVSAKFVIRRTACARAQFSGCSLTTNAHSKTGQMAVCCQNLSLNALSSRSTLSLLVGALFKKLGVWTEWYMWISLRKRNRHMSCIWTENSHTLKPDAAEGVRIQLIEWTLPMTEPQETELFFRFMQVLGTVKFFLIATVLRYAHVPFKTTLTVVWLRLLQLWGNSVAFPVRFWIISAPFWTSFALVPAHFRLTLILLTWRIWWANNASKWQMGYNTPFRGLIAWSWMLDVLETRFLVTLCDSTLLWRFATKMTVLCVTTGRARTWSVTDYIHLRWFQSQFLARFSPLVSVFVPH
jgi:hypothetical protein